LDAVAEKGIARCPNGRFGQTAPAKSQRINVVDLGIFVWSYGQAIAAEHDGYPATLSAEYNFAGGSGS